MNRYSYWWIVLMLSFFFVSTNDESCRAAGGMSLTGVVERVDTKAATIVIDVKSPNCKGTRTFTAEGLSRFERVVGKKINFFIDSDSCAGDKKYKIVAFTTFGERQ